MSVAAITVDLRGLQAAQAMLDRLAGLDRRALLDDIGSVLENSARERIQVSRQGPDGEPWALWSERYDKGRSSGKNLLQDGGDLLDSLDHEATASEVAIGSNLEYAATHQFGDPERNIPARPYLGISKDDDLQIQDLVIGHLEGVL